MLFNSWEYLVFLPAAVIGHRLLRGAARTWFLLLCSYLFYAAWDWRFLGLIWASTLVDYAVGRRLGITEGTRDRRLLLAASVVINLGILGFFKYWGFFVDSAAGLVESFGLRANIPTLQILLPVGISFYTFQTLSYTIDVYRRAIEPERRFDLFALYVAFFPQLVAGPIERAQRLIPQLANTDRRIDGHDVRDGMWLIGRGLFRKLAIADAVAPYVDSIFSDPAGQGRLALIVGVLGFSLQIYGDFAGYTDIARGSARLLGVELVTNFRQPYLARSITEFWRRWHISLSEWLRDYLYIPLGGNRGGRAFTYRNLMLTMLLGGLWHGAAWTFVVWGGLHGLYLAGERVLPGRWRPAGRRGARWQLVTFGVVALTWIPFRAANLGAAASYVSHLVLGGGQAAPSVSAVAVVGLAALFAAAIDWMEVQAGDVNPFDAVRPLARGLAFGAAAVMVIVLSGTAAVPFIYFQF